MEDLLKRGKELADSVENLIVYDEFDDIVGLYNSCVESGDAVRDVFFQFGTQEDILQLKNFIQYQQEIKEKTHKLMDFLHFIESYYFLKNNNILNSYSVFDKIHIDDFLMKDYPLKWDKSISYNEVEQKFIKDYKNFDSELIDLLEKFAAHIKGVNIQKSIDGLNETFNSIKTINDEFSMINVYDYEGSEAEILENALEIANDPSLDLNFENSIGKTHPTSVDDVYKAIRYKWDYYSSLLNNFENEEICELNFSNLDAEIQLILKKF